MIDSTDTHDLYVLRPFKGILVWTVFTFLAYCVICVSLIAFSFMGICKWWLSVLIVAISWIIPEFFLRVSSFTITIDLQQICIRYGKKEQATIPISRFNSAYIYEGTGWDRLVPYGSSYVYLCLTNSPPLKKFIRKPCTLYLYKFNKQCAVLIVPVKKEDAYKIIKYLAI